MRHITTIASFCVCLTFSLHCFTLAWCLLCLPWIWHHWQRGGELCPCKRNHLFTYWGSWLQGKSCKFIFLLPSLFTCIYWGSWCHSRLWMFLLMPSLLTYMYLDSWHHGRSCISVLMMPSLFTHWGNWCYGRSCMFALMMPSLFTCWGSGCHKRLWLSSANVEMVLYFARG